MPISESHASHIGRVAVSYWIAGASLDPDSLTEVLGIQPARVFRVGEPRFNAVGEQIGLHSRGLWEVTSRGAVHSKDVNDHCAAVLQPLLPHAAHLRERQVGGASTVDVWWESSYLYAGTGPLLNTASVQAIALLGADLNFDIYQIKPDAV